MATKKAKKPKGILEDAAGAIKNAVNALNPKPMETQNLAEYKQTVKNTLKTGATAADLYTTGGLGKSFMQNIVAPGAKVASLKTKSKAESAGLKQFAKDAAVTGATAAAGYGVSKVAPKVSQAVSNSGVINKMVNKVTRQTVMVHGTPKAIVGNRLNTSNGSVFGWNPKAPNSESRLPVSAAKYSKNTGRGNVTAPQNNVVIAKVKTSKTNLGKPGSSPDIIISKSPAKIIQIVKSEKATYAKELEDALRRAGAPLRGPKKATNFGRNK